MGKGGVGGDCVARSLSDWRVCPERYQRRTDVLYIADGNLFQVYSPGDREAVPEKLQ